ncbi:hypothetical protein Dimus_015199 [Dionaea muscipula]
MANVALLQPIKVSKVTIKPSTPTPDHLRTYNLSLLEHINFHAYSQNVFFFTKTKTAAPNSSSSDDDGSGCHRKPLTTTNTIIDDLKDSLSEVLSWYRPLAGRLLMEKKTSVTCNDEGVEFLEARIACSLPDVLRRPDLDSMSPFFLLDSEDFDPKSMLAIQATLFDCGGIAIGVLFCNKIGDARSVATFMNHWASITQLDPIPAMSVLSRSPPQFIGESTIPLTNKVMVPIPQSVPKVTYTTRRFVFEQAKIDALRAAEALQAEEEEEDLIAAFIFKCIWASFRSSGYSRKRCGVNYNIDLRTSTRPSLADNSIGNFGLPNIFPVRDDEMDLKSILGKFKACKEETDEKFATRNSEDEWSVNVYKGMMKLVKKFLFRPAEVFSIWRWSKLPFYEVDFGWGKPVWVASVPCKDNVHLLHKTNSTGRGGGGGTEAFISLDPKLMTFLEQNDQLLAFAFLNPSVM